MNKTERELRIKQQEEARRERDKQMALDPDRWPLWPRLPLKRWNMSPGLKDSDLGCLLHHAGAPPFVVLIGLMFDTGNTQQVETVLYSDIDDLVKVWRVD